MKLPIPLFHQQMLANLIFLTKCKVQNPDFENLKVADINDERLGEL